MWLTQILTNEFLIGGFPFQSSENDAILFPLQQVTNDSPTKQMVNLLLAELIA